MNPTFQTIAEPARYRTLYALRLLSTCALLIFSIAPALAQESQDDDVVRVNTDLVVVNITVTDGAGKYARGLKRADFQLMEDGREQAISAFSAESTPFAAVVLLDFSGSMEKQVSW